MNKKITLSLFLVLFAALAAMPQKLLQPENKGKEDKPHVERHLKGLSQPSAALFQDLLSLGRELTVKDKEIIEKYSLIQREDEVFAGAMVEFDEGFDPSILNRFGISILSRQKELALLLIPINNFISFARSQLVGFLDIGVKAKPNMNSAREQTFTNDVNSGLNLPKAYLGKDVVIGIIDIGFDYTHPNFWDSTQTNYRIKRVWDCTATTGTPPEDFVYGNELRTQEEIINDSTDNATQNHGSHTAGIAAGGGSADSLCRPYRGIAPMSDIVLVATNGRNTDFIAGIDYIRRYAASVGKPCVINISWGSHVGPHDGTSWKDRYFDYFTQAYPEGFILVGSAGNEGNERLHFHTAEQYNNGMMMGSLISFSGQTAGTTYLDIWADSSFAILITAFDTLTGSNYEIASFFCQRDSSGFIGADYSEWTIGTNNQTSPDSCYLKAYMELYQYNNKLNMVLDIDNEQQSNPNIFLLVQMTSLADSNSVHMWLSNAEFMSVSSNYITTAGDKECTIGELGGTGNSIISVGAYVSKKSWTDMSSNPWIYSSAVLYDIASFSSHGPTADGRVKPDITAPGHAVSSSVNSFSNRYTSSSQTTLCGIPADDERYWLYGLMSGTSMAAPVVTGILALWLEAYPELTLAQAKSLLRESAINDNYTGVCTNGDMRWGYGKVNAYDGLQLLLQSIPPKPVLPDTVWLCGDLPATLSAPEGYAEYLWSTGDTARVLTVTQQGNYAVRCISSQAYKSAWSDSVRVQIAPDFQVSFSGNREICAGQSTTIIAENVSNIVWSDGTEGNNLNVSPEQTTTYLAWIIDPYGCNTSESVEITVNPVYNDTVIAAICEGTSYTDNGFNINEAGTYIQSLQTSSGCDSILTLNLSIMPAYNDTLIAAICEGTSYTDNGFNISEAGTYIQSLQTSSGCDSILTLNLSIMPAYNISIDASIHAGEIYQENGFNVSEEGVYTQTLQTVNGCDSIITLNLYLSSLENAEAGIANFKMYPNPTKEFVHLEFDNTHKDIELSLFDMLGRKLRTYTLKSGERSISIDIRNLPSGTYTITTSTIKQKLIIE